MRRFGMALGLVLLASSATVAVADTGLAERLRQNAGSVVLVTGQCAGVLTYCAPGALGPGGCYDSANSRCYDGYTCPSNMNLCIEDAAGGAVPYCYNAALPNTCRR
ncbi:MAG: hypothetical protein H6898_13165 [Rhodobacter sp.]|nr:hypothetical protein [Rhodobacter sp.]